MGGYGNRPVSQVNPWFSVYMGIRQNTHSSPEFLGTANVLHPHTCTMNFVVYEYSVFYTVYMLSMCTLYMVLGASLCLVFYTQLQLPPYTLYIHLQSFANIQEQSTASLITRPPCFLLHGSYRSRRRPGNTQIIRQVD